MTLDEWALSGSPYSKLWEVNHTTELMLTRFPCRAQKWGALAQHCPLAPSPAILIALYLPLRELPTRSCFWRSGSCGGMFLSLETKGASSSLWQLCVWPSPAKMWDGGCSPQGWGSVQATGSCSVLQRLLQPRFHQLSYPCPHFHPRLQTSHGYWCAIKPLDNLQPLCFLNCKQNCRRDCADNLCLHW